MKNNTIVFGLLLIVVAAIVGVELAGTLITTPPPTVQVSISCTLPRITCRSFKIDSANLTVPASSNTNGTLSIALTNTSTGTNVNSTSITYFIDSIELTESQSITDNQTVTYALQVPSLCGIVSGQSSTITAKTIIGGAMLSQNITVIAK